MNEETLRKQLDQLAQAIDNLDPGVAEKARLQALLDSIEGQLEEDSPAGELPPNLAEQVDELVTTFEADHPRLTGILSNLMVTLSSMGI